MYIHVPVALALFTLTYYLVCSWTLNDLLPTAKGGVYPPPNLPWRHSNYRLHHLLNAHPCRWAMPQSAPANNYINFTKRSFERPTMQLNDYFCEHWRKSIYIIAVWDYNVALSQPIGLEVCDGCDPGNPLPPVEAAKIETKESLDLKRRKELNRIKKKYGLRVSTVCTSSNNVLLLNVMIIHVGIHLQVTCWPSVLSF